MTNIDKNEAALDWHEAQAKWHARREGKWHKSQARWHRKAIGHIPGVLNIIISRTIRKHTPALVQNIAQPNALFRLMTERQSRLKSGAI